VHYDMKDRRMPPITENLGTSPSVVEQRDSESTISLSGKNPIITQQVENAGLTIQTSSGTETCVGVVDEYPFTRECISSCLKLLGNNLKVLTFSSIEDCMTGSSNDFDLILFHIHGSGAGQQRPDQTIASLKPTFLSVPVIILSDLDANEWILEALESGARGYIPTGSTSVAVALEVIRLVRAGGTFLPSSSLRLIQHSSPPGLSLEEPLTQRQLLVLQHLTQGRSNKIIAFELGMSESTVKVHVRNIMKKMQATNRTEAAFRARNLSSAKTTAVDVTAQVTGRLAVTS
jgi:DNA-binding NarL/FixJ family response regulator